MLYLKDIKLVDLANSKWDKAKSNPKEGRYVFEHKEYIDYFDKSRRPEWFLSWARYQPPDFRDLLAWKHGLGYIEVNVDTDNWVWPEPLVPNENGNYVYRDVILVKRPLIDELKDRIESKEISEGAATAAQQGFNADMRKYGAEIPQEQINEIREQEKER